MHAFSHFSTASFHEKLIEFRLNHIKQNPVFIRQKNKKQGIKQKTFLIEC